MPPASPQITASGVARRGNRAARMSKAEVAGSVNVSPVARIERSQLIRTKTTSIAATESTVARPIRWPGWSPFTSSARVEMASNPRKEITASDAPPMMAAAVAPAGTRLLVEAVAAPSVQMIPKARVTKTRHNPNCASSMPMSNFDDKVTPRIPLASNTAKNAIRNAISGTCGQALAR